MGPKGEIKSGNKSGDHTDIQAYRWPWKLLQQIRKKTIVSEQEVGEE